LHYSRSFSNFPSFCPNFFSHDIAGLSTILIDPISSLHPTKCPPIFETVLLKNKKVQNFIFLFVYPKGISSFGVPELKNPHLLAKDFDWYVYWARNLNFQLRNHYRSFRLAVNTFLSSSLIFLQRYPFMPSKMQEQSFLHIGLTLILIQRGQTSLTQEIRHPQVQLPSKMYL